MNYMQALRYITAKGKQKAILVYWGRLKAEKYDLFIKEVLWSEYNNEKMAGTGIVFATCCNLRWWMLPPGSG
ncbi:TPA: hypothetical protein ACIVHZ_003587 [Salmonella enterica subsp. enterica serovar Thompson]|nr:hypothetical protein [Salmonella enterica]ECY7947754.1 hypothetical protein [Salmonella enterica subsp. enterica serovar Thompson]EHI8889725.1 hypothetical protein [Salmonella enterica]EKA8112281.1 hypothetical protein [Salmonella enterica]ELC5165929.1 hypothetical protein [Salmonella enterica]